MNQLRLSTVTLLLAIGLAMLSTVHAALPFYDWAYGAPPVPTTAYTFKSFPNAGLTITTGSNATGGTTIVGLGSTTGVVLWQVPSPCATLAAIAAHPSREAPDAIAVLVCGTKYVGVSPGN